MNILSELKHHPSYRRKRKRVGRGPASGVGKTSGRGHKGQLQRGPGPREGFEGGQMPIVRIMPKRGFTAIAPIKFQIVNLSGLERVKTDEINSASLYEAGLIKSKKKPVKILGQGEVKKALKFKVNAISRKALEKIKKAGGSAEQIA